MNCQHIQHKLAAFIEGDLQDVENKEVASHLASCPACQQEKLAFERSWNMLGEWPAIEPSPGYVSAFWTRLAQKQAWHERLLSGAKQVWAGRLAPVFVTACLVVIVGVFAFRNTHGMRQTEELASLSEEDIEMVENLELAENFDLINDLDLMNELDVIEHLDMESAV